MKLLTDIKTFIPNRGVCWTELNCRLNSKRRLASTSVACLSIRIKTKCSFILVFSSEELTVHPKVLTAETKLFVQITKVPQWMKGMLNNRVAMFGKGKKGKPMAFSSSCILTGSSDHMTGSRKGAPVLLHICKFVSCAHCSRVSNVF